MQRKRFKNDKIIRIQIMKNMNLNPRKKGKFKKKEQTQKEEKKRKEAKKKYIRRGNKVKS